MELPCTVFKSILMCVFSSMVVILTAFSIVTMLPCQVFKTETVTNGLRIAASLILALGTIIQVTKRFMTAHITALNKSHSEMNHVFRVTWLLALLASILSLVIFVWDWFLTESPMINRFYFLLLASFLASFLSPSFTLAAFDKDLGDTTVIDRFFLASFLAIYIQINFFEAQETLMLYEVQHNCTLESGHHNSTIHHDDPGLIWYEGLIAAAYAITVEVMVLMIVCLLEQKKKQRKRKHHPETPSKALEQKNPAESQEDEENPQVTTPSTVEFQPPTNREQIDETIPEAQSHGSKNEEEFLNQQLLLTTMNNLTILDILVFLLGFISVLSIIASLIAMHVINQISKYSMAAETIIICKTAFFTAVPIYTILLFCLTKPWLVPKVTRKKVSGSLDIRLLRWSTYGILLALFVVLAGVISGPPVPISQSPMNYSNYILNALQVWLQYSFLLNCVALKKCLKKTGTNNWVWKVRIHVIPLGIANTFFWVYNLFQWKTVIMLPSPRGIESSPGPVWAVTEAIIFPIAIFFRFHSMFLCFILCRFSRPNWAEKLLARWRRGRRTQ